MIDAKTLNEANNIMSSIKSVITSSPTISLKEMDNVSLMKRVDTKFIINERQLALVLKDIIKHYKILKIGDNRIHSYRSLYFDTKTKQFYNDHHNGKTNRTKIRIRKYLTSNLCFLEIKQKDIKGVTNKSRNPLKDFELSLSNLSMDYIKKITLQDYKLSPTLWNQFDRITLVNNLGKERVTIDLKLFSEINELKINYKNLVIVEVKQQHFNRNSPVITTLKEYGHHPYKVSKYCIGMSSLLKELKHNAFKEKLLKINKLIN